MCVPGYRGARDLENEMETRIETETEIAVEGFRSQNCGPFILVSFLTQEWPQQQWCRENFSYLTESNFENVPAWLQSELMAYGHSHNCTLMLENLFNVTRRQARRSHTGTLDAKGMWHATAFGQCPAEFERPVVPITAAAKSMSQKKLPNDVFTPDKDLVSS